MKVCGGLVCGVPLRAISIMTSARRSRSMTSGETKPPPLPRTSTMSAFFRICGKYSLVNSFKPGLAHVGNVDVTDLAVRFSC